MQTNRPAGESRGEASVNPADQARLDGLNFTARALVRVGTDPSRLVGTMADQIAAAERESRRKVVFRDSARDGVWFRFGARSRLDYVQVVKPKEVRMLSARVGGVLMSANLMKPGAYDHDNADVAKALRALADIIDKAPVRLADRDVELPLD